MIVWKSSGFGLDDVPEPLPGLDPEFDHANTQCEKVKEQLNESLNNIKLELLNSCSK
jgi:hypothetical protein